jgi:hypothetical protein
MRKNLEKCGLNLWDFEKSPVYLKVVREWAKKIRSPKPRQNTAKKKNKSPIMAHSHENWSK